MKGYIDNVNLISEKAKINVNSILVQNIIAHITKPHDHIKIIACIPSRQDVVIVDTINQITITSNDFSNKFIWSLLNSKLLNWYSYLFIFAKAIRTMHFDNTVTERIPIPKISSKQQQPFITLVDKILADKKTGNDTSALEREIDVLVYGLYGLSEEEIAIVEGK